MLLRCETKIDGFFELRPKIIFDDRGSFVKVFNRSSFVELGLSANWSEQYYSSSKKEVIRGMHFQAPPFHHAKLVYCIEGEVLDVALDLRIGSSTYGQTASLVLSREHGNMAYLAPGLAHGFYVLSDSATLIYNVTSEYSENHDSGIHWNSFGFIWPTNPSSVSNRDAGLVAFDKFHSPFE